MIPRVAVGLLLVSIAMPIASASRAGTSAGWALTTAQLERLESGAILSDGEVSADPAIAEFRAVVRIAASPEKVFQTLTDCSEALQFVPHLKRCVVVDTAPDGSWQEVEQTVDYGLLAPKARYVFHAVYQRHQLIRFTHVKGDFHENEGAWEFEPVREGRATLVFYRARVSPAFYLPRWLMRMMLKRDLPELMRGLRTRAEAG